MAEALRRALRSVGHPTRASTGARTRADWTCQGCPRSPGSRKRDDRPVRSRSISPCCRQRTGSMAKTVSPCTPRCSRASGRSSFAPRRSRPTADVSKTRPTSPVSAPSWATSCAPRRRPAAWSGTGSAPGGSSSSGRVATESWSNCCRPAFDGLRLFWRRTYELSVMGDHGENSGVSESPKFSATLRQALPHTAHPTRGILRCRRGRATGTLLAPFASILRRNVQRGVEFLIVTNWESIGAIEQFAGRDSEIAVVPETVQNMMLEYDRRARHYEVLAWLASAQRTVGRGDAQPRVRADRPTARCRLPASLRSSAAAQRER